MDIEIGKMISKLRNELGLNQRELASILGVSNGAIGMWETGKRQPDLDTISKIASYFGVSIDYLLGNETTETNKENRQTDDRNQISEINDFFKTLSERERNIINLFRELTEDNQDIIVGEIKKCLKEQRYEKESMKQAK